MYYLVIGLRFNRLLIQIAIKEFVALPSNSLIWLDRFGKFFVSLQKIL